MLRHQQRGGGVALSHPCLPSVTSQTTPRKHDYHLQTPQQPFLQCILACISKQHALQAVLSKPANSQVVLLNVQLRLLLACHFVNMQHCHLL